MYLNEHHLSQEETSGIRRTSFVPVGVCLVLVAVRIGFDMGVGLLLLSVGRDFGLILVLVSICLGFVLVTEGMGLSPTQDWCGSWSCPALDRYGT